MKKLFVYVSLLFASLANAATYTPFVAGNVLTAAQLNAAFNTTIPGNCLVSSSALTYQNPGGNWGCNTTINAVTLNGNTFSSPGPIGNVSSSTGAFSSLTATTATVGGGSINATTVGASSPSTGAFTTLSASSTVSGAGITALFASPPGIGSTSPGVGVFTNLSAQSSLGGTGVNNLFASPPVIGNTAPNNATFTALTATGNFTPSQTNGIVGTTTNNNANTGSVGEFVSSSVASGSAIALAVNTPSNVTSITLSAGDWDVQGEVYFTGGATTVGVYRAASVSQTSATLDLTVPNYNITPDYGSTPFGASTGNTSGLGVVTPVIRKSLSGSATIFLVAQAQFSTSTMSAYGSIRARRVR